MRLVLDNVLADVKEVKEQISGTRVRLDAAEDSISNLEDKAWTWIWYQTAFLENANAQSLENLENRSRHNNLRITGLPEGIEGDDMVVFLEDFLPKLFKITFDSPFEIERAHRLPLPKLSVLSRSRDGPRVVIFNVLCYT